MRKVGNAKLDTWSIDNEVPEWALETQRVIGVGKQINKIKISRQHFLGISFNTVLRMFRKNAVKISEAYLKLTSKQWKL